MWHDVRRTEFLFSCLVTCSFLFYKSLCISLLSYSAVFFFFLSFLFFIFLLQSLDYRIFTFVPPISSPTPWAGSHYGTKPGHFETLKIHFPTSSGVSEVSYACKQANGRASGPVLTSGFLVDLAHCAKVNGGMWCGSLMVVWSLV